MGDDSDSPSLATFGETMLRYTPTGDERLETSETFAVHTGGAESNVAVAAARLGLGSAWLSRLPDTPLGRRIAATLRRHGVDPLVDWTDGGRVGTYYLEPGGKSRTASVTYDRVGTRSAKPRRPTSQRSTLPVRTRSTRRASPPRSRRRWPRPRGSCSRWRASTERHESST